MIRTAILGFPRMGQGRELKRLLEAHWSGQLDAAELEDGAARLRKAHRQLQKQAGISELPSGDFCLYDHMLDLAQSLGAIPDLSSHGELSPLEEYFLLARGRTPSGKSGRALEMTKWFDTNYHYLVPEVHAGTRLSLRFNKARRAYQEALADGVVTRPVLVGPVSFLLLSKNPEAHGEAPLSRLLDLLPAYGQMLRELAEAGAHDVQLDEPCLTLDLSSEARAAYRVAYAALNQASPSSRLHLASYFGSIEPHLSLLTELPLASVHLDLVTAPEQLEPALAALAAIPVLSLGVINGRNVWRADLASLLEKLQPLVARRGADRVILATSCSLLHCPLDLAQESALDPELSSWLSFGVQKLRELNVLAQALAGDSSPEIATAIAAASRALALRHNHPRVHRTDVEERLGQLNQAQLSRSLPYPARARAQRQALDLPLLPTTTIGSFPQTDEIRRTRAAFKQGKLALGDYEAFIDGSIRDSIARQEELALDVLVHGEPERNDMVEYFASQLDGFAETEHGWVQSYGSRCVKPPLIYGAVHRPRAMTVREARVAQAATKKPVKGMLTGPVTLLKWSFVREDQPLAKTAQELGLVLRDEVRDLEDAGLRVIQVDEPALREGLPLRKADQAAYLAWSVEAFRLATAGARPETQIHTHMCYAEFREILTAIVELDADVISIESARSRTELLEDFSRSQYPNEVGPGVYDIHSPRVPERAEMVELLRRAALVIEPARLWVNPDCGLKTRSWGEVTPALRHMVEAARQVRSELALSARA